MGFNLFRKKSKNPMLQLARNPRAMKEANDSLQEHKAALETGLLSDRKIRSLIKKLEHDSGPFSITAKKLGTQGRHAEDLLIQSLQDPSFLNKKCSNDWVLSSSPAKTVISLLADCRSSKASPTLFRLLNNDALAEDAMRCLITVSEVNDLKRALQIANENPDSFSNHAIQGISNRFYENTHDHDIRPIAFRYLTHQLMSDDGNINYNVVQALITVDQHQAQDYLTNDKILFPNEYNRKVVLREFASNDLEIEEHLALKIFETEKNMLIKSYAIQCSTKSVEPSKWMSEFDNLLKHIHEVEDKSDRRDIPRTLLDVLSKQLGYKSYYELMGTDLERDERLPAQQQLYIVDNFVYNINNGGFS